MKPSTLLALLPLVACGAENSLGAVQGAREGAPPPPVTCTDGTSLEEVPVATETDRRWVEGTVVFSCVDDGGTLKGPHLERFGGAGCAGPPEETTPEAPADPRPAWCGATAAVGQWEAGARSGTWRQWTREGGFASRVDFVAGTPEGLAHYVSDDGAVVEVTMQDGVAVDLRVLDRDFRPPEPPTTGR